MILDMDALALRLNVIKAVVHEVDTPKWEWFDSHRRLFVFVWRGQKLV